MKTIITVKKEVEVKTLHVEAKVRYWEDAYVNGINDTEGKLIPCREGDLWKPIIDLETGQILNWKQGIEAEIHYKVCDAGSYFIKDEGNNTILSIENDYVPKILCPADNGYGDYIIMDIDKNGFIQKWEADIYEFTAMEEE